MIEDILTHTGLEFPSTSRNATVLHLARLQKQDAAAYIRLNKSLMTFVISGLPGVGFCGMHFPLSCLCLFFLGLCEKSCESSQWKAIHEPCSGVHAHEIRLNLMIQTRLCVISGRAIARSLSIIVYNMISKGFISVQLLTNKTSWEIFS